MDYKEILTKDSIIKSLIEMEETRPNCFFSSLEVTIHLLQTVRDKPLTEELIFSANGITSTWLANMYRSASNGILRSEETISPALPAEFSHLKGVRSCWGYRYSEAVKVKGLKDKSTPSHKKSRKEKSTDVETILSMLEEFSAGELCQVNSGLAEIMDRRFSTMGERFEKMRLLIDD